MYISTYQHASYKKIQAIKKGVKRGAKSRKQRQPRYSYSITVSFLDQRIFQVGNPIIYQAYCVASLNMKNLISPTPLNCARNAFTLALNDSADAFVRRLSK